jgi:5-methylcytosine-specific restriction endonuclease McrA
MKEDSELPFIDKKDYLSAELRRLSSLRHEIKKDKPKSKSFKKSEKVDVYKKTNGICHICGCELDSDKFSVTNSIQDENSLENYLPACQSCKRIFDNYLPSEIKWMLKIGMWAKTQIEYETEIGLDIATEIVEHEKDRENKRKSPRTSLNIDVAKYPIKENPFINKNVKKEYKTIKEVLYWSYANLGMAYKAIEDEAERYNRVHYSIRAKLFNGLMSGEMNTRSLFYDEKAKLNSDKCCVYCGSNKNLQLDHIIPRKKGGADSGDNLVLACRTCNASKNDTDLMEWHMKNECFPPLNVLRNYMKLIIQYCTDKELLNKDVDTSCELDLPFAIEYVPLEFPQPTDMFTRYITD